MKIKDLRTIKSLADLDRADLPPKELKGAWWRELGTLVEPTSSHALMALATRLTQDAEWRLREAKQAGRVTAEVERDLFDTLATVRELKRRADALRPEEERARRESGFDPRATYGPPFDGPRDRALLTGAEAKTYRALFAREHKTLDDGGFASFAEFLRVASSGRWDPRLEALEQKAHLAGVGPLGGFAVPEAWASFLFDAVVNESAILPRARVVPMTTLQLHVPAWDDLDQSTGKVYGGFAGAWLAEGDTATEETASLRKLLLTAHKLAIFTSLSRELILGTDSAMQAELRQALTRAVAAKLDEAFLTGDDVRKPEGVLNAPALKTVNRAGATAVSYGDLVAVFAGLHPAFAARATWYINPSVLPELLTMEDTAGHLVWQPSGRDAAPTTIFGRPVVYTDRLPTLGAKGDVLVVADGAYVVGMLQNIAIDTTNAAEWKRDLISLRCVVLADGMLSWNKFYTAPDNKTYSTAVALDVPA